MAHGHGGGQELEFFELKWWFGRMAFTIYTLIALAAMGWVVGALIGGSIGLIAGIGLPLILFLIFVAKSLGFLATDPHPESGILKFFGEWAGKRDEHGHLRPIYFGPTGMPFLPFQGLLFDMDVVNVEAVVLDFHRLPEGLSKEKAQEWEKDKSFRAIDGSPILIPLTLTYRPHDLATHEMMGGTHRDAAGKADPNEGVPKILHSVIDQEAREWIRNPDYGPLDYDDALSAGDDAIASILESLLGRNQEGLQKRLDKARADGDHEAVRYLQDQIDRHHQQVRMMPVQAQGIRLEVLLRYFSGKDPSKSHIKKYGPATKGGPAWERLEKILGPKGTTRYEEVRAAVEARQTHISMLVEGKGNLELPGLGIRIDLLNLGRIRVTGPLADAIDQMPIEKVQLVTELANAKTGAKVLKVLKAEGLTPQQAADFHQAKTGDATRKVNTLDLRMDEHTAKAVGSVGPAVALGLAAMVKLLEDKDGGKVPPPKKH